MATNRRFGPAVTLTCVLALLVACSGGNGRSTTSPDSPAERYPGTAQPNAGGETRVEDDPLSTFALDVDTASYGYAGRRIRDGRRPEPKTIRPEEFVNAFAQNYPEPSGNGFAVHLDGRRSPVAPPSDDRAGDTADGDDRAGVRLMRVGLQTRPEDTAQRPDAALTFVVDVSGSMAEPGRLDLVRDSLHTLVDRLRPTDSVAIVAFSDEAHEVREMTRVADADRVHAAIDRLRTEGSTNLEGGLVLGYRVARNGFRPGITNRVIVLSDGLANVGNTEAEPILRRVREEADKQITMLGVGVGSEYGDSLMERLADRGDGFVVYVSRLDEAREVFVRKLPATLAVRARDAKAQVTFDPASVRSYRLIGYDNRAVADSDFRNDRVDGGEVGPGHSVTALYAVRLRADAPRGAQVARVQVRWLDPGSREAAETGRSISVDQLSGDLASGPPELRVCYAAAYFAEVLRGGPGADDVRLAELADVARRAYRQTQDRKVEELADLIERARTVD